MPWPWRYGCPSLRALEIVVALRPLLVRRTKIVPRMNVAHRIDNARQRLRSAQVTANVGSAIDVKTSIAFH